MKLVTQDVFYKKIGRLDVCLKLEGRYPYTTLFTPRYGRDPVGKSVGRCDEKHQLVHDYYLTEALVS